MSTAVRLGLISEQERNDKYNILYKNMVIRKRYRNYFSKRDVASLLKLIKPNDISFRRKLSYIKEHILYLKDKAI